MIKIISNIFYSIISIFCLLIAIAGICTNQDSSNIFDIPLIMSFGLLGVLFFPYIRNKINEYIEEHLRMGKYSEENSAMSKKNKDIAIRIDIGIIKLIAIIILIAAFFIVTSIIDNQNHNPSPAESIETTSASTTPMQTPTKTENNKWTDTEIAVAQVQCERRIKTEAINPNSVKIKWRWVDGHLDTWIEGNTITLYGTIDSQNAYGATVQRNFACEVVEDKVNDKVYVKDLNID